MKKYILNAYVKAITGLNSFIKKENGDTNFISILIILGIVVVLAALFLTFKDQIIGLVTDKVNEFTSNY